MFKFIPPSTDERDLVREINDYWAMPVVNSLTYGTRSSKMQNGVPHAAFNSSYRHKDIVRVRKFGRVWNIQAKKRLDVVLAEPK